MVVVFSGYFRQLGHGIVFIISSDIVKQTSLNCVGVILFSNLVFTLFISKLTSFQASLILLSEFNKKLSYALWFDSMIKILQFSRIVLYSFKESSYLLQSVMVLAAVSVCVHFITGRFKPLYEDTIVLIGRYRFL